MSETATSSLCKAAGTTSVGGLFRQRAAINPDSVALVEGNSQLSYAALNARVNRAAHMLLEQGLKHGDRLALLARNCSAYIEIELAAAKIGVIVAAINWRLADVELQHCIGLVTPKLLIVATDYVDVTARLNLSVTTTLVLGKQYEQLLATQSDAEPPLAACGEDGLVILYTSGTTGLPKGAVVSHRAMIACLL